MYGRALPGTAAGELGSAPMSALSGRPERRGGVEGKKKRKENRNKTTTKCFTNPAVNESGSLQHFFYALLIPQGDKRNAEPAPGATSPTRPHCKHCRLPHFMSVNPFKPTGKSASQSGRWAVGRHQEPSVGHTGGPSLSGQMSIQILD